MRQNILHIAILMLVIPALNAQTIEEMERESVVKNKVKAKIRWDYKYINDAPSKEGTKTTKIIFNSKGLILEKNIFNPKGEVTTSEKFEYDANGNRTLYERKSTSGKYVKDSKYNEEDLLVLEGGYDGSEPFKTTYKYNDQNKPLEIIYMQSNQVDEKRLYKHEENKAVVQVYSRGNNLMSLVKLIYDDQGRITDEVTQSIQGIILERKKISYASGSKIAVEEKYKGDNLVYKTTYDYNSLGDLTSVTEESTAKGKFVKKKYLYNDKAQLIEYQWRRRPTEDFNLKKYTYNEKGLIVEEYTLYPASKFQLMSKYTYEFY